jgi:hypothetical protein
MPGFSGPDLGVERADRGSLDPDQNLALAGCGRATGPTRNGASGVSSTAARMVLSGVMEGPFCCFHYLAN